MGSEAKGGHQLITHHRRAERFLSEGIRGRVIS
jgi:hypothetical protein